MSINEIRALENRSGIGSAGDTYIQPLNMGTVAQEASAKDDRSWAQPLLEDALMRGRRVQENKERTALKRKGDHYGEWRILWREQELPSIMVEILAPSIEAICRSVSMDSNDTDITIKDTVDMWIESDQDDTAFAIKTIKGIT